MAGNTTANGEALIRAELWSNELKDILQDGLMAQGYVNWLNNFPDGNQLTIPSIGTLDSDDYVEDTAVNYQALDTGEFNFTINKYKQSGTYITNKMKQDSFYTSQLVSQFTPKMSRAIMEQLEQDIFKEGQPRTGNPAGYQVAGNANSINGAAHRFVGSTLTNSKQVIGPADFAHALHSLKKANVPDENLIAIVDPSVEYLINTTSELVSVANNPRWEGIIDTSIAKGMRFIKNIYGFDVYTSNRLPLSSTDQSGAAETIGGVASTGASVCNLFFSASPDILPYIGAWRQMPKVDGEYNKDFQREEYVTTCRYGVKIYRPENLVTVLSDPSIVS